MRGENVLTLAVAGSGKTKQIVDACAAADDGERILVLTYTMQNQQELRTRLAVTAGHRHTVEVVGWFTFLINHFVRPYTPYLFPGRRVGGFETASGYQQKVKITEVRRYFTVPGDVRSAHLPHLAVLLNSEANGRPIARLERIFDVVYIDEAQDLTGYDLEVLKLLFDSRIEVRLVGDTRQATLSTNPQEPKNKGYRGERIVDWFREQERGGRLRIEHSAETWRCRPEIAAFADDLFDANRGYAATESKNTTVTDHDGLYLVRSEHVDAYVAAFAPQPLRASKSSGKAHDHLPFMNFGIAKGSSRQRVLVFPTAPIRDLLQKGKPLAAASTMGLYVAVTRARQSVAFILDEPGISPLPYWRPDDVLDTAIEEEPPGGPADDLRSRLTATVAARSR